MCLSSLTTGTRSRSVAPPSKRGKQAEDLSAYRPAPPAHEKNPAKFRYIFWRNRAGIPDMYAIDARSPGAYTRAGNPRLDTRAEEYTEE